MSDANYFTKIDLTKGYFQIYVKEEDRPKTAFQTPKGLFQWIRMPFGLVSAPATFARAMRELLGDSAINFFDDILIASSTWEQHLRDVRMTLQKLQDGGFTAKPSKVFAGFRKLEFLGHVVGEGCLRPMQDKLDKIVKIPTPKTKTQVRSILGLIGYYKKFLPKFSTITAPITDLLLGTKQKGPIGWTPECEAALKKIQEVLSGEPVLLLPDLERPFIVRTDASDVGIGGVLLQEKGNFSHPVAYASRKLLGRETRYSTIERECLGIVWTLSKFQRYLWGKKFLLETDHKPLSYLTQGSFKNARIMRWALSLQEFCFDVRSVPGAENIFADMMSRSEVSQIVPS